MIEYYLIFCLLIPCVEVLLHTIMDSLRLWVAACKADPCPGTGERRAGGRWSQGWSTIMARPCRL
jgi:hypothetical protein